MFQYLFQMDFSAISELADIWIPPVQTENNLAKLVQLKLAKKFIEILLFSCILS